MPRGDSPRAVSPISGRDRRQLGDVGLTKLSAVPSGIRSPAGKRIRRLVAAGYRLKVPQRRASCFTAGVAADHAAALLPASLALDLVGGGAVLGHAPCHAHPPAVAAEEFPIR